MPDLHWLIESGAGIAKSFPAISAPDGGYEEGVLAIWTQTPMIYSSPQRHSPASVLHTGIYWNPDIGAGKTAPTYRVNRNRWALMHGAGHDIHSPAGLPAGFNEYYGYHYLLGGSVRCVHDQ